MTALVKTLNKTQIEHGPICAVIVESILILYHLKNGDIINEIYIISLTYSSFIVICVSINKHY
jgi:hypothetical protein